MGDLKSIVLTRIKTHNRMNKLATLLYENKNKIQSDREQEVRKRVDNYWWYSTATATHSFLSIRCNGRLQGTVQTGTFDC